MCMTLVTHGRNGGQAEGETGGETVANEATAVRRLSTPSCCGAASVSTGGRGIDADVERKIDRATQGMILPVAC